MHFAAKIVLSIARSLPRGGFRVVRLAARIIPDLRAVPIEAQALPGIMMYGDLSESVWYPLWRYGYYPHQRGEEAVLEKLLAPEMVVFDVGANIGYFSAFFALRCRKGRVIAFEPSKRCHAFLVSLANQLSNIEIVPLAVADQEGIVRFMERAQLDRSGIEEAKGAPIACCTLDGYCMRNGVYPDFVKVDVEGADARVLRGARNVLRDHARFVMFEALDDNALGECIDALWMTGRKWIIHRITHDGAIVPVTSNKRSMAWTNNFIACRVD